MKWVFFIAPALLLAAAGCSRDASPEEARDAAAAERVLGAWRCEVTGADAQMHSIARLELKSRGRREETGTLDFRDGKGGIELTLVSSGAWRIEGDRFYSTTESARVTGGRIDGVTVEPKAALPQLVAFVEQTVGRSEVHRILTLSADRLQTLHPQSGVETDCRRS